MTYKTPQEQIRALMHDVSEAKKETYTKGEVKNILNSVASLSDLGNHTQEIAGIRRGDVFIAKMVGGKVRPWVVLSVRSEIVCAVCMSGGDRAPHMTKSECRLWPGSWIGSTVSLFAESLASKAVTRPYTNAAHLRDIERKISGLFELRK